MRSAPTIAVLGVIWAWTSSAFAAGEVVFEDWRVSCPQVGEAKTCQMLQTQPATDGGTDVFLLSISQSAQTRDVSAVISVPLGVYLAPGIEIHISGRRPFKVLYEICDQTSCHAGFKLKGAALATFKKGIEAKFRVWTAKSKAVEFPVSLRGFTSAYADLTSKSAQ